MILVVAVVAQEQLCFVMFSKTSPTSAKHTDRNRWVIVTEIAKGRTNFLFVDGFPNAYYDVFFQLLFSFNSRILSLVSLNVLLGVVICCLGIVFFTLMTAGIAADIVVAVTIDIIIVVVVVVVVSHAIFPFRSPFRICT